jgi:transcriptional regulator GlxA family with amidase domain
MVTLQDEGAEEAAAANPSRYDGHSAFDWMNDCNYHVCVVVFRVGSEHARGPLGGSIMTRIRAVSKTTHRGGLARWQVELALRLLLNDSGSGHSLKQIAAHCGLSRSHFEKAFKVSLGTPPHRWLMRQRIQQAGEKLEHTNDSVSSIAVNCGFTDQSHLTRVFGAIVGSSPAAWRRQRKASVDHDLSDLR